MTAGRLDRLLYALVARSATGAIAVELPDARKARIELLRGFVHALAGFHGAEARPEEGLRWLLKSARGEARFVAGVAGEGRGRVTPFHPAGVVRNHVEAELGPGAGLSLRGRAGGERIRLVLAPHPSCLGPDEKRLCALLAAPRTMAELDGAGVATPLRVERFLAFLDGVGALALGPSLRARLGLHEGAALEEVRRAYKRQARDLHPDLHPHASAVERRAMEARLAELTAAWRALLDAPMAR